MHRTVWGFFFALLFHGEVNKLAETLFSATLRAQIQQITVLYSLRKKLELSYTHKEADYKFSEKDPCEEISISIFLF